MVGKTGVTPSQLAADAQLLRQHLARFQDSEGGVDLAKAQQELPASVSDSDQVVRLKAMMRYIGIYSGKVSRFETGSVNAPSKQQLVPATLLSAEQWTQVQKSLAESATRIANELKVDGHTVIEWNTAAKATERIPEFLDLLDRQAIEAAVVSKKLELPHMLEKGLPLSGLKGELERKERIELAVTRRQAFVDTLRQAANYHGANPQVREALFLYAFDGALTFMREQYSATTPGRARHAEVNTHFRADTAVHDIREVADQDCAILRLPFQASEEDLRRAVKLQPLDSLADYIADTRAKLEKDFGVSLEDWLQGKDYQRNLDAV